MSWSTSELRVRLAPLNRFKPSSKIFYWPFQGGTSFVDLLCFCSVLCLLCFVRVCLYVLFGHLLGKGWPLGSRLWCLLWVCHVPIGILGQVWYLIVSIPDLWTITYFYVYLPREYPVPRTFIRNVWMYKMWIMNCLTKKSLNLTLSCLHQGSVNEASALLFTNIFIEFVKLCKLSKTIVVCEYDKRFWHQEDFKEKR